MDYTMSQVTLLTGIQSHTLRVWERRYDFVKAKRKKSKFRYYTEEQLKILLNTSILLQNGFRISSIASLDQEEMNEEVEKIFNKKKEKNSDLIQALVLAMLTFDEALFNKIFDKSVESEGMLMAFTTVIYPFLNIIGGMWMYDKANPAQEHFISNLIRQKLVAAIDNLPSPDSRAQTIVMFLLEGEDHELGLLLGYYLAKKAGWKVLYLGVRVPADDLHTILSQTNAKVLFSTFTLHNPSEEKKLLHIMKDNSDIVLAISGDESFLQNFSGLPNVAYLDNPKKFTNFLEEYRINQI